MSLLAAEPTSLGQISEVLLIHHLKNNSEEGGGSICLPVLCLFCIYRDFYL